MLRVAVGDPLDLVKFVAKRMPIVDAGTLIRAGAVHVNGKRTTDWRSRVTVGAQVTVFAVAARGPERATIAWQDEHFAIVDKPAGQRSQAVRERADDALDADVRTLLGADAVAMHRLDRDTSGLVLIARTPTARAAMAPLIAEHRVVREYVAITNVHDVPARIALPIARALDDNRLRRALPEGDPNGEPAVTHCTLLARSDEQQALTIVLETGRTHQIRVHLAAVGAPIVGDTLYGGAAASRLYLHATALSFVHPITNEPVAHRASATGDLGAVVADLISSQTASH